MKIKIKHELLLVETLLNEKKEIKDKSENKLNRINFAENYPQIFKITKGLVNKNWRAIYYREEPTSADRFRNAIDE